MQTLLSDVETALGSQLVGATILRIRGELLASHQTVPAVNTQTFNKITLGFLVGTAAMAAGTSANWPDPDSMATSGAYADWMGYETFQLIASGGGTVPGPGDAYFQRKTVDIKAKRRLDEIGDTLLAFAAQTSPSQVSNLEGALSILVALP